MGSTIALALVDLYLEGEERPIGVTPNHRVFSLDRGTDGGWVEAGALRTGERLGSASQDGDADERGDGQGVLVVARVEPRDGMVAVYNLEVSRYHTYFVGDHGVWVHNSCTVTSNIRDPGLVRATEDAGRNRQVQAGIDHLFQQLKNGNLNAGGAKVVAKGIIEVRHPASGARVYFRMKGADAVEIVAKSSKKNQAKVIQRLKELYGE